MENTSERIPLIKYCFSGRKEEFEQNVANYYTSIVQSLIDKNLISNLITYSESCLFGEEPKMYCIEDIEKYIFSFSCNEKRNDEIVLYNFSLEFQCETYEDNQLMYVTISSNDYTFSVDSDSNCLEILKHQLRGNIKDWTHRYCLLDKQSEFYAVQLYPKIYEVENFARYYINDVFVKVFGANWWNEAIAQSLKDNRKERIKDTRNYAGAYKDIQPYLLSLELNDLINVANTKRVKWVPTYDLKIENILNKISSADIKALLMEQCETQIDVWKICFEKFLPEDFLEMYHRFEKRRNQIAHNKLLSLDAYQTTNALCKQMFETLESAYTKFCNEFISKEEQELLDEYIIDLEEQQEAQRTSLEKIAESESGVTVHSTFEILEIFDETLFDLYAEISQNFEDRNDLYFGRYTSLPPFDALQDNHMIFSVLYHITNETMDFKVQFDLNDGKGETSKAIISTETDGSIKTTEFSFVNGAYSFDTNQSCYMPETYDELNATEFETAKVEICNFIEERFPNLKETADYYNHLSAMGKSNAITENDVYCCDCGEEYICINEEYAEEGTCLNCGAKNHIINCMYCGSTIEAVDEDDFDEEEIYYCDYCQEKLFGPD